MTGEASEELKTSDSLEDTSTEDESSSNSNDSNADSSTQEEAPSLADAIAEGLDLDTEDDGKGNNAESENDDADADAEKKKDDEPAKDADDDKEGDDKNKDDKSDDELYKEPEGLQEKSRERFQALVESHKELSEELSKAQAISEEVTKDVEDMRGFIEYSGATPEEFTELLEYSHLCKSGNTEDLKAALGLLDKQRESLASILGVDAPGVDVLGNYPDLKQAVDDMEITKEHALELASSRRREQIKERQTQENDQVQQKERVSQDAILNGSNEVDALSNKWASEDIDFPAKRDKLMAKAKDIAQKYPPNMWADLLTDYYSMLGEVAPAPKPAPRGGGNRPLRPSGGNSGSKQPASMADAISQGLNLG